MTYMDIRHQAEIKREALHNNIVEDFKQLTMEHPDARPYRLIKCIATTYRVTVTTVYNVLKANGLYETNSQTA